MYSNRPSTWLKSIGVSSAQTIIARLLVFACIASAGLINPITAHADVTITGSVFLDWNRNGSQDMGERGAPQNATVTIRKASDNSLVGSTIVSGNPDSDNFSLILDNATAASLDGEQIYAVVSGSYYQSTTTPSHVFDGSVNATNSLASIPVEMQSNLQLSVFHDTNNDGVRNNGESGLANVDVKMLGNGYFGPPSVIHTYTTDTNGYFYPSIGVLGTGIPSGNSYWFEMDTSDPDIPSNYTLTNTNQRPFSDLITQNDYALITALNTTVQVQSSINNGTTPGTVRVLHDTGALSSGNPYDSQYNPSSLGGQYGNITTNQPFCDPGTFCYQFTTSTLESVYLVAPPPSISGLTNWTGCNFTFDFYDNNGNSGSDGIEETCQLDIIPDGNQRVVTAFLTLQPPIEQGQCALNTHYCAEFQIDQGTLLTKFISRYDYDTLSANTSYTFAGFPTISAFDLYQDGAISQNGSAKPVASTTSQNVSGHFYFGVLNGSGRHFSTTVSLSNFALNANIVPLCSNTSCNQSFASLQSQNTIHSQNSLYEGQNLTGITELTNAQNVSSITDLTASGTSNTFELLKFSEGQGRGEYYKPVQLNLTIPAYTPVGTYGSTLTFTTTVQ